MEKSVRLVVPGDKVVTESLGGNAEIVRSVSVVLHMANGFDVVLPGGELVTLAPDDVLLPSETELLASVERESENHARQQRLIEEAAERGRQAAISEDQPTAEG